MPSPLPTFYASIATALEAATGLHDDGSGIARFRQITGAGSQGGANHRRFTFVTPLSGRVAMSHGPDLPRVQATHRLRLFHAKQNRPDDVFALDVYQDACVVQRTLLSMADTPPANIEGAPTSLDWTHDDRTGATDFRFGVLALEPAS